MSEILPSLVPDNNSEVALLCFGKKKCERDFLAYFHSHDVFMMEPTIFQNDQLQLDELTV